MDAAIWQSYTVRTAVSTGDVGAIVRAVRVASNLTLAQLAERCGYSVSTVSRMERGKQSLRDVQVLRALAEALRIPPRMVGLADTPAPSVQALRPAARVTVILTPDEESDPMRRRALLAGLTGMAGTSILGLSTAASAGNPVDALETSLLAPPAGTGVPADLAHLRSATAAVRATFYQGRYTEVAARLPDLLSTALATRGEAAMGEHYAAAAGQVAELYLLTSELMVKLSRDALAWTTADRAVQSAHHSGDLLTEAAVRRQWAIVLRRAGHAEAAQRLVVETAAALLPDLHRGADALAVYGSLLSTAAYTAAVDGDRDSAETLIQEAVDAANRLGPGGNYRFTAFDASGVGVYRINIARVLGDYGTAVDTARRVNPATITLAEQRARYWSNVARSFHEWGKPQECYRALLAAEQASPDEVRYRQPIQQITGDLLRHPISSALPGLRAFAGRAGVHA